MQLLVTAYEHGNLQASLQALHKARRAALERQAAKDETRTDHTDVSIKIEESSVDPKVSRP